MTAVVWEEPPPSGRHRVGWFARLAPLMDQPGRWARVRDYETVAAGTTVRNLREGRAQVPPGKWEFEARYSGVGGTRTSCIYARYVGPE